MWKNAMFAVVCMVLSVGGLAQAQDQIPTAAMVVSSTDLSGGFDQAMYDRLVELGYEVTAVTTGDIGSTFTRDDADTYDLLLVSETISSSGADPLIGTTTPVMHNEAYGWDNWFFTTGADIKWESGSSVEIVNDAHPIVARAGVQAGTMAFFSTGASWTTDSISAVAPGAELIAQTTSGAIVFAIEEGAQLANGSAALNRSVAFSIPGDATYAASAMTNEAWALFDAAVGWLTRSVRATVAKAPSPADAATDVPRDVVLSWAPGESADTHDVYFGTSFDDVNEGVALVSPGQDANSYAPGRLEFGQTYFWRVDEVNAPPDSTVFEGGVWSFTVEPFSYPVKDVNVTASIPPMNAGRGPERTIDGSGLTDGQHSTKEADMWLGDASAGGPVWLRYDFDQLYQLYDMQIWNHNSIYETLIGLGAQSVTIEYATEADNWMVLGDYEIARATSLDTYAGTTIDLGSIMARSVRININSNWGGQLKYGLAEIRFFYIPVAAREPDPEIGATDVSLDPTLNWRAGREAETHQVYFGTDSDAVANGTALMGAVPETSYSVSALSLGTTYYWRVDEVNEAETPSAWAGPVWNFTTTENFVVDGFETYTDETDEEVYATWADGYGDSGNGSQVGHDMPPYAEQAVRRSGGQSMPVYYGKEGASHSETTRTFAPAQDWTQAGANTLALYVYGAADNESGQFYVKVNGVEKAVDVDFTAESWQEVNIDLASLGIDVEHVTSLALSIEGAVSGLLLIDDIQLCR